MKIMKRQRKLRKKKEPTSINVRLGNSDGHSTENNVRCWTK